MTRGSTPTRGRGLTTTDDATTMTMKKAATTTTTTTDDDAGLATTGVLRYSEGTSQGLRLALEIADAEIARYARSLIPKHYRVVPPMYPLHVSVIRHEPVRDRFWRAHEGELVTVMYDPCVLNDDTYWWLPVCSPKLAEVRIELGLPPSRGTVQDLVGGFHMTIGNTKGK